ncbi:sensor histidine kinase [Hymenobacter endophyticus]|uniref:Histidine kinase n=1 Tax=Hymenobacter endophyticus TaxID=3076335 RepID=A0ABU3TER2_9BACT|nr:histidine kinase [Hymenobacter endophyticus]MDU0369843.1 histidine kinase [Hymenobacter endophyticus]
MTKRQTIGLHLLCWTLWAGYIGLGLYFDKAKPERAILTGTILLAECVEFYLGYLWVFPRYLRRGRLPQLLLGVAGIMATFIALRYLLEQVLLPAALGFGNYDADTPTSAYVLENLYWGTSYIVLSAAVWGLENAFRREREHQQLQQEKTRAELAFLKTQINPHFLYNTLNYLYAEAYLVSEPLADAVLRLSDLMRYMLTESPDGTASLQHEVDYLRNYLALHRLRFEDQFFVEMDVQGAIEGQRVAALLLIPFVENALKHGVTSRPECLVQINLRLPTPRQLRFEVRNHISQHQKDHTTGIGLANIRRRLELLYPGRHHLEIRNDGTMHHTRLELELA